MFSTLHTSARAALIAALIGGSALAVPSAVRAQSVTPERALLNRPDATPGGTVATVTQQATAGPIDQGVLDGERALLNPARTAAALLVQHAETVRSGFATAAYTNGVRALLNRRSL